MDAQWVILSQILNILERRLPGPSVLDACAEALTDREGVIELSSAREPPDLAAARQEALAFVQMLQYLRDLERGMSPPKPG